MLRIGLIAMMFALLAPAANAQGTIWNPDSPRGRREAVVNPPAPAPLPGQETVVTSQPTWGSISGQVGQSSWGTIGSQGWTGQ